MDVRGLQKRLQTKRLGLRFTDHALIEARKDGLTSSDLEDVAAWGEVIEDYGTRALLLGLTRKDALPCHVVLEFSPQAREVTIVTAYVPDRKEWLQGWRKRKRDRR